MTRIVLLLCLLACLTGCLSFPSPEGTSSRVSYIGDRRAIGLGTMQIPIVVPGSPERFENLSITFAALINTESFALLSDTADVWKIVNKSQKRVFARATDVACGARIETGEDLKELRKRLIATAQEAFDDVFVKWSDAEKYSVEIVIISMTIGSKDPATTRFGYPPMW